jgi:hypothetical protein
MVKKDGSGGNDDLSLAEKLRAKVNAKFEKSQAADAEKRRGIQEGAEEEKVKAAKREADSLSLAEKLRAKVSAKFEASRDADAEDKKAKAAKREADAAEDEAKAEGREADAEEATANAQTALVKEQIRQAKRGGSGSGAGGGGNFLAIGIIFLTFFVAIVDYLWLHFGGLDFNVYFNAVKAGGVGLLLTILFPIYTLVILLIYESVFIAKAKKFGFFLIMFFGLLLVANFINNSFGSGAIPIIGISFTAGAIIVAMLFASIRFMDQEQRSGFYSWALILGTLSSIYSLGGLISGWHHLIMAFIIWIFISQDSGDRWKANYIVSALLILDFFGFGIIGHFAPSVLITNRFIFPIWFLFVVFYSGEHKNSNLIAGIMLIVVVFYTLALVDGVYGWVDLKAQIQANPEEIAEAKSFFKNSLNKFRSFPEQAKAELKRGINEASGGHYESQVANNQDASSGLGVYLENIKPDNEQFSEGDKVTIAGDLKAKNLDLKGQKPIELALACKSGEKENEVIGEIRVYIPTNNEGKFEIEDEFDDVFECRFKPGQLKPGVNIVEISAEFPYPVVASLDTYFMDSKTARSLENPLEHYGFMDAKNSGDSSYGPAKLGMGTRKPPIGLIKESGDVAGSSFLGITLENVWQGKIKEINSVVIHIPEELNLEKEDERDNDNNEVYCGGDFKEYTEDSLEGYNMYKMRDDVIDNIETPIKKYQSWRCGIEVANGEIANVMDGRPVAPYSYSAKADYVYEIKKTINVRVKSVADERTELKDCETTCKDVDGCECDVDGCVVSRGEWITKSSSCNDYEEPVDESNDELNAGYEGLPQQEIDCLNSGKVPWFINGEYRNCVDCPSDGECYRYVNSQYCGIDPCGLNCRWNSGRCESA